MEWNATGVFKRGNSERCVTDKAGKRNSYSRKVGRAVAILAVASFALMGGTSIATHSQNPAPAPSAMSLDVLAPATSAAQEAPSGFDGQTNGMIDSTTHTADQMVFQEVEEADEGLGPIYNAQSCAECHQNPTTGGISQVTELRVGTTSHSGVFTNPNVKIGGGSVTIPNRSLINDRAVCPSGAFPDNEVQERVPDGMNTRTLRTSLNTLGDGFIEAIASTTITQIASNQCRRGAGICGQAILVPVLEVPGQMRVARFGWKNQHASLLSFSADAYLNEQGVTSRLLAQDMTTLCKTTQDPEDHQEADGLADIDRFARFMRSTKVPARDATLAASFGAQRGADVFDRIQCDTCHVSSITTAPTGSVINGGAFVVPEPLGNKIIHPYSDFLLHNVGTGDGIVQNGGAGSANKMRTPPLWGVRLRNRLLHDGRALTFDEAIRGHGGEASGVVNSYRQLSDADRQALLTFLRSL